MCLASLVDISLNQNRLFDSTVSWFALDQIPFQALHTALIAAL